MLGPCQVGIVLNWDCATHFVTHFYSFKSCCNVACSSCCCNFHFNTVVHVFSSQASLLLLTYMCYTLQFMFLKIGFLLAPNWYFYKLQWGFDGAKQLVSGDTYSYGVELCSAWISALDKCLKDKYLELFNSVSLSENILVNSFCYEFCMENSAQWLFREIWCE